MILAQAFLPESPAGRDGPLDCDKVILTLPAVIVRLHLDSTLQVAISAIKTDVAATP